MAVACRKSGRRAWLAIGNNASRGAGTPDPAERNVGGSFIDVNAQSGHALEAQSPPVVPAGFALALFSHLKAGWTPPEMPPVVPHTPNLGLAPRFGVFLFLMHATPVIEGWLKPALKKYRCNGEPAAPE